MGDLSRPEVGFPALCRKEMLVPDVSEYGSSATALDYHLGMDIPLRNADGSYNFVL